jgi:predicted enzyme related to lactoylglutathione lyase
VPDGKICYVEIPANDVEASARFYADVFRWSVRKRGDGSTAFDDTTGAVSGAWVLGRPPHRQPGLTTYIMVDSVEATLRRVVAAGGKIATPLARMRKGEAIATFEDPAGNVFGLYQEAGA